MSVCHFVAFFMVIELQEFLRSNENAGSLGVQQLTRFFFMLSISLLFRLPCLPLHLIVRNKTSSVCYAKKLMPPLFINLHLLGDPQCFP